jgi:hypothetical protein
MPTSTWRTRASELVIVAGVLLVASVARADYREAYRKGVLAAGDSNWPETARLMRAALSEHPREGEAVTIEGSRREPYAPRYYLGLALYNSGDCLAARRQWERAQRNGSLRGSPFERSVEKLNQECQRRLPREAAAQQAARAVEGELRKAEALAGALAVLEANPGVVGDEREAVVRGLRDGRERLADARSRLDGGRRSSDLGDLGKAREQIQRATDALEKARRKAMRNLEPTAAGPADDPVVPQAEGPSAPPELVTAVHAYFAGRYEDAATALGSVDYYGTGPAALQVHLIRAAASHALYVLGGSRDAVLLQSVMADVEAVRGLDPAFEPSESAFPPRFRRLFRPKG